MRILIIGAMKEEVDVLLRHLAGRSQIKIDRYIFYKANLENHELLIVSSGVGKVMAGYLMGIALNNFKIDLAINIGVAGGNKTYKIGDVILGTGYVFGDVDLTPGGFGYKKGQLPGMPQIIKGSYRGLVPENIIPGIISTEDIFLADLSKSEEIEASFPGENIACFDMESSAYAYLCLLKGVPFFALRCISDIVGDKTQDAEYDKNLALCIKNVTSALFAVLKLI